MYVWVWQYSTNERSKPTKRQALKYSSTRLATSAVRHSSVSICAKNYEPARQHPLVSRAATGQRRHVGRVCVRCRADRVKVKTAGKGMTKSTFTETDITWKETRCSQCGVTIRYRTDWNYIPDLCRKCLDKKQAEWKEKRCTNCGTIIRYNVNWDYVPDLCTSCFEKQKAEWKERRCANSGQSSVTTCTGSRFPICARTAATRKAEWKEKLASGAERPSVQRQLICTDLAQTAVIIGRQISPADRLRAGIHNRVRRCDQKAKFEARHYRPCIRTGYGSVQRHCWRSRGAVF